MGGAVGHLQHLYDNPDLTFGEIKDIISSAAEGRLERVSEKFDGMNLVFTFNASTGELSVARSGSDIKRGGMDFAALAKKFQGRGDIELAFTVAFRVLTDALSALDGEELGRVFGSNGDRWYSIEVIYTPNANVINYDSNHVIFHGWPVFDVNEDGTVSRSDDPTGIDVLSSNVERMQRAVTERGWRIRGPSLINMKRIADGSVVQRAVSALDAAMRSAGVGDDATLRDYLRSRVRDEVASIGLDDEVAAAVVERSIKAPGAPNLTQIKKSIADPALRNAVSAFVNASERMLKSMMVPIERAITGFAIDVLRGVGSTLIARSDDEVARLRARVERAIKTIGSSGNQAAIDIMQKELQRLRSLDDVSSSVEGIMFLYRGQAYKFTGAFAPVSSILSLFRYDRSGVPKVAEGTRMGSIVRDTLIDAVKDVVLRSGTLQEVVGDHRTVYVLDPSDVLYRLVQERSGWRWRTLERRFVSSDPDDIVRRYLGPRAGLGTFEGLVEAVQSSRLVRPRWNEVRREFMRRLGDVLERSPNSLGSKPGDVVEYVRSRLMT